MKKRNTIKAAAILCIMHCALCINIGCTSDEQTIADGEPITFTATGIASTTTRSTVNGDWDGLSGKSVAIQIGNDVKQYAVTPNTDDNTKATLKAADGITPFYWNNTADINVTAWYPYEDSDPTDNWTVKADQSVDANYIASDLLKVSSQQVTYDDPTLTFEHQVAKIVVKADISSLPSTTLSGASLKGVSGVENDGTSITMHKQADNIYEAIVTSQAPTSARLILPIDNIGTYTYSFDSPNWQPKNSYTYTLTVSGNELALTNCTIEPWTSEIKEKGKTMTPAYPDYTVMEASTITDEVPDKTIITGTNTNGIKIASGATVVLCNANISSSSASAIKCSGDATITLVGTNTAKAIDSGKCGIEAGPSGTTLTINGRGSLEAKGNIGAGIGSASQSTCGNITINGGTITANGGWYTAGIGTGYNSSSCENIEITDGYIEAAGDWGAAGIGCGHNNTKCGTITISGGTITARAGNLVNQGIGAGYADSSCGKISITGGTVKY